MRSAALLADIGGTRARFALLREGDDRPTSSVELVTSAFGGLEDAARGALERMAEEGASVPEVSAAAVAVAGPVLDDRMELTNAEWRFSIETTRRALGLERLEVVNDVAAIAHALPALQPEDIRILSAGVEQRPGPQVVLSVGTGLGMAIAAPVGTSGDSIVLSTEGGHRDLAAKTELEWRVIGQVSARYGGHASAERIVSGEGLSTLHECLSELAGVGREALDPEEVGRRARAGEPRAVETLALWSEWLGAVAGDAALTCGAIGGVWIAGGVVPRLGGAFDEGRFRERFLAKGRFRAWLERLPVRLVIAPDAAFRGLARCLARSS